MSADASKAATTRLLMPVAEAAGIIGVKPVTIKRAIKAGKVRGGIKLFNRWMVPCPWVASVTDWPPPAPEGGEGK